VSLTREELRFIDGALTVRLCTISANRVPLITPLWFGRDGDTIYLGTRRDSLHARNIQRNPRVLLLFGDERGRRTRHVLRVTATATLAPREALTRRRQFRMATRYYLPPRAAWHWLRNWRKRSLLGRYHAERQDIAAIEIRLESAEFLEQPVP
jgi:general stress protein 26